MSTRSGRAKSGSRFELLVHHQVGVKSRRAGGPGRRRTIHTSADRINWKKKAKNPAIKGKYLLASEKRLLFLVLAQGKY